MKPKANSLYNTDALDLAERLDSELFDLIYLDPPWGESHKDLSASEFDYEEFLYKFLQQARRLLKPTGHLFFHATPLAKINFQALIEPVFGRENLRSQFILPLKSGRRGHGIIGRDYNTLFLYSKEPEAPLHKITRDLREGEVIEKYPLDDENGRYRLESLYSVFGGHGYRFRWKGFYPPGRQGWKHNIIILNALYAKGKIEYKKGPGYPKPMLKRYQADDVLPQIGGIWDDLKLIDREKRELRKGTQTWSLFERVISLGSAENDWVFDPFCGTGTSLLSASSLGRNWVGNDLDTDATDKVRRSFEHTERNFALAELPKTTTAVWNNYKFWRETPEETLMREISQGENYRIEFKEAAKWNRHTNRKDKGLIDHTLKEICAFMNSALGGKVILGVQDNGEITGIEDDINAVSDKENAEDAYNLFISDNIANRLSNEAIGHYLIHFYTLDQKRICTIEIDKAVKPVFFENDFYVRNQTQAMRLKTENAINYMDKHFNQFNDLADTARPDTETPGSPEKDK
ncbi:MAG: hypothetical protein HEP71_03235 [Roseivirga sp.]|nr:hypothetical protein [Roseivirga sp.]